MSLDKKLQKAYDSGYIQCVMDYRDFLYQVANETPGIGKVLEKRLIEAAEKVAKRKVRECDSTTMT